MIRRLVERLQGSVGRTCLHVALKRIAGSDLPAASSIAGSPSTEHGTRSTENASRIIHLRQGCGGQAHHAPVAPKLDAGGSRTPIPQAIGIDIENADNLPWSGDPCSEPFYVENFTSQEIAYCLRQPDPRLSFCGLWSAKEAVLKCGPPFSGLRLIQVEIHHDENGRPLLQTAQPSAQAAANGCLISLSYSGRTCIALCIRNSPNVPGSFHRRVLWFSLALSLLAIILGANILLRD